MPQRCLKGALEVPGRCLEGVSEASDQQTQSIVYSFSPMEPVRHFVRMSQRCLRRALKVP